MAGGCGRRTRNGCVGFGVAAAGSHVNPEESFTVTVKTGMATYRTETVRITTTVCSKSWWWRRTSEGPIRWQVIDTAGNVVANTSHRVYTLDLRPRLGRRANAGPSRIRGTSITGTDLLTLVQTRVVSLGFPFEATQCHRAPTGSNRAGIAQPGTVPPARSQPSCRNRLPFSIENAAGLPLLTV